jgi:hypothetical protein
MSRQATPKAAVVAAASSSTTLESLLIRASTTLRVIPPSTTAPTTSRVRHRTQSMATPKPGNAPDTTSDHTSGTSTVSRHSLPPTSGNAGSDTRTGGTANNGRRSRMLGSALGALYDVVARASAHGRPGGTGSPRPPSQARCFRRRRRQQGIRGLGPTHASEETNAPAAPPSRNGGDPTPRPLRTGPPAVWSRLHAPTPLRSTLATPTSTAFTNCSRVIVPSTGAWSTIV